MSYLSYNFIRYNNQITNPNINWINNYPTSDPFFNTINSIDIVSNTDILVVAGDKPFVLF